MTFINILCYLGSCIVSIFQKPKNDQSQIHPTSFGGEALKDVSVDHDSLLIPENPAGPAPLDMILVDDTKCTIENQRRTAPATIEEREAMKDICGELPRDPKDSATLNVGGGNKKPSQPSMTTTEVTVIIDQALFYGPLIKGNGIGFPLPKPITDRFPNSVDIAVQGLTFKNVVDSLRSRILMLFLEIERDLPAHWIRDELPERRINSMKDLADVVLQAPIKTAHRTIPALASYGIYGDDRGKFIKDCGYDLFRSRPEGKAKEWIHVSFTVQNKPSMTIFLQKDADAPIPLGVSSTMTLGDVRQRGNLRSGRFTFGDLEYTEKDDNSPLADLGVCAESILRFISWMDFTVQIDALYFYPSRLERMDNGYLHHPADDHWDLPITVDLKGPGSTFLSFTDLLRSHILNNVIHKLPQEWQDEFKIDEVSDVFLFSDISFTVWALKKHGIATDLEDKEIWKCWNTADHPENYAHVLFKIKNTEPKR